MTKARGYAFTINNPELEDSITLFEMPWSYLIVGFEKGEEGTKHLQCYAYFPNQISFSRIKEYMKRAHIEVAQANAKINREYCSKGGRYLEFGDIPQQGKATWEDIEAVMQDPTSNFQLYNQYKKNYDTYKLSRLNKNKDDKQLIFIHFGKRKWILTQYESTTVFFDANIETYDKEDVVVVTAYACVLNVNNWYDGFIPGVKRGFQIVKIDPTYVYVLYKDSTELGYIKKLYKNIPYTIWSNESLGRELVEQEESVEAMEECESVAVDLRDASDSIRLSQVLDPKSS